MKPVRIGAVICLITLLVDQGFKHWMLDVFDIENHPGVHLGPFLDVIIAWNRGVSYSLFTATSAVGRFGLLAVYLAAMVAFGVWMIRAKRAITGLALGLLMGGATGNALDRVMYGAVADFFHVHFGGFSPWGVFNLADMAIVAGVGVLMYESFFMKDHQS